MKSTLSLFGRAALVSQVSASVVRLASPQYLLKSHVVSGNHSMEGLLAGGFHTGAGTSAVRLTSNETLAMVGYIRNGTYEASNIPGYNNTTIVFEFAMPNTAPTYEPGEIQNPADVPPAGFNSVMWNDFPGTPGFAIAPGADTLVWADPNFRGFAACYVDGIDTYFALGPQIQLLWRNASAGAPSPRCAEIELQAVYV